MRRKVHKNQVIIMVLAALIAVAGFVTYDKNSKAMIAGLWKDTPDTEAKEVAFTMDGSEIVSMYPGTEMVSMYDGTEVIENPGESILTNATANNEEYAAQVKLNREQVRSKNKEALMTVINNETLSKEQKQEAVDAVTKMTETAEKEANAEMMLKAKGFKNAVVSISDNSCDVVVEMPEQSDAKRAQVEDIVKRKTGVPASSIVITVLSKD